MLAGTLKLFLKKLWITRPLASRNAAAAALIAAGILSLMPWGGRAPWMRALCALPLWAAALVYIFAAHRGLVRLYRKKADSDLLLTKQKLLTKRKMRLASYFDRVLQDAGDVIFTLDVDGYILKFNTGAEDILGYKQHEIVGTPLARMLSDPLESDNIFNQIIKHDRIQNREVKMRAKSGGEIDISMTISEMRGENNQIMGMVATCKDMTQRKALERELLIKNKKLEELAITDNLSSLFNVRHFHGEIKKALAQIKRNLYKSLTLVLIDVDHFKELNDTQGHQVGDTVIEKLGALIKTCIRQDLDTAYRYGGDEFVVLLPDTDAAQSTAVAERVIRRFGENRIGRTSLSVGIATACENDDEEKLVQRADTAMYVAKRAGGGRFSIAEN